MWEDDGGKGAGPSEPRAARVVEPISLPSVFDNPEDYEAAWERGKIEAIAPEELFPPLTTSSLPVDAISATIFQGLRAHYQSATNQRIPKPATAKTLSIEAAYVRLALIYEKKSAARSEAHDHRIIFGEAGVGKSILSQYLAYHWSRTENPLWGGPQGRFQAVFWIRLKELLGESRSQSFESLLCKYCMPTLADQVAVELRTWLTSHADRVLFILDGYDEVADAVLGQNLVLKDFIDNVLLRSFVVITSRPYRYSKISAQPIETFAHYRNIGFRSEDFPRYLEAYFAEDPQNISFRDLIAWLDQHLIAKSIARVPLQLGMIAWLWQDAARHQGRPLPDIFTLSTLYQEIAQRRLEAISSAVPALIEQCLNELAYGGMNTRARANRYHFSTERIRDVLTRLGQEHHMQLPTLEQCFFQEVLTLGFLRSETGSFTFQQADYYYFCHLTYQEYYCARYILMLFARIEKDKIYEEQIVELIAQKKFEQRYARVWWFVAGLLGEAWKKAHDAASIQAPRRELVAAETLTRRQLAIFFNEFQRGVRDIIGGYDLSLLGRCVEESQIETQRFAHDFPELSLRLQAGVKLLERAVKTLSGISLKELQTNSFLNQLRLSPHVRLAIADRDLVQSFPENRGEMWQELISRAINPVMLIFTINSKSQNIIKKLVALVAQMSASQREAMIHSFLNALENSNKRVQQSATDALNCLVAYISASEREAVINQLLDALENTDEEDPQRVVATLGRLAAFIPETQRQAVINQLLLTLGDSDEVVQQRSVDTFGRLASVIPEPEDLINQLLLTLTTSDEVDRQRSVDVLGQLASVIPETQRQAVINQLSIVLTSSNKWFRQHVLDTLGRLATFMTEAQLKKMIKCSLRASKDPNEWIRQSAVDTLGRLARVISAAQRKMVINQLLTLTTSDEVGHRAINTLGQLAAIISASSEREAVISHLLITIASTNSNKWLRQGAVETVSRLLAFIPEAEREQMPTIREEMLKLPVSALTDSNEWIRQSAVGTYSRLATFFPEWQREKVIKQLLVKLAPADEQVQEHAVESFKKVQQRALSVLGQLAPFIPKLQHETVINQLLLALKDSKKEVQESAAISLGQLAAVISEVQYRTMYAQLLANLKDPNKQIQIGAELGLSALFNTSPSPIPFARDLIPVLCSAVTAELSTIPQPFLLFHTDLEVRIGALLMLTLSSVHSLDWRSQRLLALSTGYLNPTEDHSVTAFNQATLKDIAEFLRLILLFCTRPELRERLCLFFAYLCFAHQLAITVEEEEIHRDSRLKVYRQESSEIIPLNSQEIESALDNLRQIYVEEIDDPLHHPQVFPEVPTLIRDQRLWGLFRLPADSINRELSFVSLIAPPQTEPPLITSNTWMVGVGAYKFGRWFDSHAFLVIEGMDEYGRGLFLRYDLARDPHSAAEERYHVIAQKILSLQEEPQRNTALLQDILKGKTKRFVCCHLRRETEAAKLVKLIEADVGKDMTAHYRSLGERFMSLQSSVQSGRAKQKKINCLTWVLQHLKVALGEEKFQSAFGELEQGLPIPINRVKVMNKSRHCSLM